MFWHAVYHCRVSKAPFTFIVNIMVPASPPYQLIMSWAADAALAETANFTRHATPAHFAVSAHASRAFLLGSCAPPKLAKVCATMPVPP